MVYRKPKAVPMKWGKWHGEAMTKGERLGTAKLFSSSPSVGLRRQLPRARWRLFVRGTNSHIKPALKGDSSRARPVGDAARGESGGIGSIASGSAARRPYSNQRCGCECNEQTEGLQRGFCCLRQPLSQTFGLSDPRPGSLNSLRKFAYSEFPAPLLRRATPVGTRSPYSLPFVILPVPARSPFRFIRHRRRSTPNLKEGAFWAVSKLLC